MTLLPAIAMIEESVVFGRCNSRLQEMRYHLEHPQEESIIMLFQQSFYYNYSFLQCPPCRYPNSINLKPPIRTSSRGNLQNRRPSNNSAVVSALSTVAKHQVALTVNTCRRDLDTEVDPITGLSKVSKHRAVDSDESGVKLRGIGAHQDCAGSLDRNGRTGDHRASGCCGNGWVGLDRERRVVAGAGLDERRRESVHGVRRERDVLRRREGCEFL
jgi:hypothetical protein